MNALSKINALGAMVGAALVAKEITFNGQTETFFFKELGAADVDRCFYTGGDEERKKTARTRLISHTLCNEDGSPALTDEEAGKLRADFAGLLEEAAMEVSGLLGRGKKGAEAKNA